MTAYFNHEKMYTYVNGFAMGRHLTDTLNALSFARRMHKEQKRKSGEPYITHPLTMACHALSIGITDDHIIAGVILHDVVEDCGARISDLPVSDETKEIVKLMTFVHPEGLTKTEALKLYYDGISSNGKASMVKILDRCNNVSTMSGVFSEEKLRNYILETEEFVLPLIRHTKEFYPEYRDMLWILKYHIVSVLESLKGLGAMKEEKQ